MIEFMLNYGLFLLKSVTLLVVILLLFGGIISLAQRAKKPDAGSLQVKKLNDELEDLTHTLQREILSKDAFKQLEKDKKKTEKELQKQKKLSQKKQRKEASDTVKENTVENALSDSNAVSQISQKNLTEEVFSEKPKLFVLDFKGDIKATAVNSLAHEITALLSVADPNRDEVLVRVESPGGLVHAYGLAASQLARIKKKKVPLTIAVDKVAASGGYMMAVLADRIISAPFAVLGSIGVVAQLPNFHRILKKHDIDVEVLTAGEYKRTLTFFGENTEAGRKKFISELEDTHELFKTFVMEYRPQIDIKQVATGEHWYGTRALNLNLVDELMTSDEFLTQKCLSSDVFHLKYEVKKPITERFALSLQQHLFSLLHPFYR